MTIFVINSHIIQTLCTVNKNKRNKNNKTEYATEITGAGNIER